MNKTSFKKLEHLAATLNEPFDLEADLYKLLMEKLTSVEGVKVPLTLNEELFQKIDDLTKINLRGNLLKIPLAEVENAVDDKIHFSEEGELLLQLQIKQKHPHREIVEFIENLQMTSHEVKEILMGSFESKLKEGFIKLLSENKLDLVKDRLSLWGIVISKKFEFYIVDYSKLSSDPLKNVYNIYTLHKIIDNFFEDISNEELFSPDLTYLQEISNIYYNLLNYNLWLK